MTRCARVWPAMDRIWGRLRERLPRRVSFPCDFKTDQFAFLDEGEVEEVQLFKNMLNRGRTTKDVGDMPTFN